MGVSCVGWGEGGGGQEGTGGEVQCNHHDSPVKSLPEPKRGCTEAHTRHTFPHTPDVCVASGGVVDPSLCVRHRCKARHTPTTNVPGVKHPRTHQKRNSTAQKSQGFQL